MCNPISCVLTKESVYFGDTDSHEEIIQQHGLHEGMPTAPNFVRVEVRPPGGDTNVPVEQWVYHLDQDILPVWYDEQDCMTRACGAVIRSGVGRLYADYKAKRATLYADYEAKLAPLGADYKAKLAPLYADYKAKRAPLYADYEAKRHEIAEQRW